MRIARFLRLPGHDRVLLAQAALFLVAIRLCLWVVPFSRVQRLVERFAEPSSRTSHAIVDARRIAWAVDAAARSVLIDNCLARAVTAQVLLRRFGYEGDIRIGVAREPGGGFVAHAWVESDGHVLIGDDELERYQTTSGPGRIA